jgi:hypothetical protein
MRKKAGYVKRDTGDHDANVSGLDTADRLSPCAPPGHAGRRHSHHPLTTEETAVRGLRDAVPAMLASRTHAGPQ